MSTDVDTARHEHRLTALHGQHQAWRQARDLTDYLDALEQHTRTLTGTDQEATLEWLTWARHAAETLNPLRGPLGMPEDPDFTRDQLQPRMRGFPPYPPGREW